MRFVQSPLLPKYSASVSITSVTATSAVFVYAGVRFTVYGEHVNVLRLFLVPSLTYRFWILFVIPMVDIYIFGVTVAWHGNSLHGHPERRPSGHSDHLRSHLALFCSSKLVASTINTNALCSLNTIMSGRPTAADYICRTWITLSRLTDGYKPLTTSANLIS